ncbi:MAG: hypothetical protein QE487_14250 [Fluviicola sp.]|nr:hypothetical protein [Fluviicola sp.]
MIRNTILFLVMIHFGHYVSAQYDGISLNRTILMDWAVQQHLLLNEQPGKSLRLSIMDHLGNYVVYAYEKLNDSIYREVVKESNVELKADQLYIKRGNTVTACYPLKDGYSDRDFSGYRDSAGYLVRDTIVIKRGKSPFHRRDVVLLDSNYNVTKWWTYDDGMDSVYYCRESNLAKNCSDRNVYFLTKTDSIKHSYMKSCSGDADLLIKDKKVFVSYWEFKAKREVLYHEWIVSSNRKRVFYLVDVAAEPRLIGGKLMKEDEVKIKTDKKGCIKRINSKTFIAANPKTAWLFWLDE